ncbi:hypothetical protein DBR11_20460 [Pedobacter sp. HMWF019]|uniref:beta-galactosidase n=1 Tax=Pedobacter sp. HMWF019 TaxID=2056856 RepID=UPI000D377794|nr:beta-galactosidase [Pedobacter sp. HMWF019]PTS95788.1 hypothetical protein DBR11_20460 [Pedobacter sp. HMWF019]
MRLAYVMVLLVCTLIVSRFSGDVFKKLDNSLTLDSQKVYVLIRGDIDQKKIEDILQNKLVSGITYYLGWSRLNPQEGVYDFAVLHKVVGLVAKAHKKINIGVLPGRWSPLWVGGTGAKYMGWIHQDNYVESGKEENSKAPVPWDEKYLSHYFEFLHNFKLALLPDMEYVNSIAITGGSNTNGIETNFIADQQEMNRVGFNFNNYTTNWKKIISEFKQEFPSTVLTLSIHNIYGDERTDRVSKDLIRYIENDDKIKVAALAFTDDAWFRKGNQYADLVLKEQPNKIVLQSIKIYSKKDNESGFKAMMKKGVAIHPAWIEVWGEDVEKGYLN